MSTRKKYSYCYWAEGAKCGERAVWIYFDVAMTYPCRGAMPKKVGYCGYEKNVFKSHEAMLVG